MGSFTVSTTINAPTEKVWQVLADIGSINRWNPGVEASFKTNELDGMGGARHCKLKGTSFLQEEVVRWEPEKYLTMRITNTDLPFKHADINFVLRPSTSDTLDDLPETIVEVNPVYTIKFGILGKVLDLVFVSRTYQKGMQDLLNGLKTFVETNRSKI